MLESDLTVTSAAADYDLTSLAHVKLELGISDTSEDSRITALITQASAAIAAWCGRVFAAETVTEQFWPGDGESLPYMAPLVLGRYPVSTLTSVTLDGDAVSSSNYRLDAGSGRLFRLDDDGYPCTWRVCKLLSAVYVAGYELLDDLPSDIERAAIQWVKELHYGAERDPRLRSEQAYNVASFSYFDRDGNIGEPPPEVAQLLSRYRSFLVA